jgi:hypothetical protein
MVRVVPNLGSHLEAKPYLEKILLYGSIASACEVNLVLDRV